MRSNKKILLCGPNENELSRIGYVMWSRHYDAVLAVTKPEALEKLAMTEISCAVVIGTFGMAKVQEMVRDLRAAKADLRMALLVDKENPYLLTQETITCAGMAQLLEWVRVSCRRKRGPKKAGAMHVFKNSASVESDLQRVG